MNEDTMTKTEDLFKEIGGINDTQTNHKVGMNTTTIGGINVSDIQRCCTFGSDSNQGDNKEIVINMNEWEVIHVDRQFSAPNTTVTDTKTEDLYPNRFKRCSNNDILMEDTNEIQSMDRQISDTITNALGEMAV